MANDYFQFRQFTIHQAMCAMKVGTDGTLLGAWARGGRRILDVGTGTGLIALMMAQRFPDASIVGVDIDEGAVQQARSNVENTSFADRVSIKHCDFALMQGTFDAIVCNPPFFVDSLPSPDHQRTLARHSASLPFSTLIKHVYELLDDSGEFSLVIPAESRSELESEAYLNGFSKCRECGVRTKSTKPVRRYLLAFRKHPCKLERSEGIIGSEWYRLLTQNFYL